MPIPCSKKRPLYRRDIALLLLVAAFSLFSLRELISPEARETKVKQEGPAEEAAGRPLASFPVTASGAREEKSIKVIEIGCLNKADSRHEKTAAGLMRVMAESCSPASHISATNEATGETLLIFRKEKKVSTHYFPLRPGKNRVVIKWADPKGKEAQTVLEVEKTGT